jgi:hypothetical protein
MDFAQHTYKITKENKKDPTLTVIEKGNITSDFTIADFQRNIIDMEKTVKELSSKYQHDLLVKQAIERHDPFVLKLTEDQRYAVAKYIEVCEVTKQYRPKIKQFANALAAEKLEMEYVKQNVLKIKPAVVKGSDIKKHLEKNK